MLVRNKKYFDNLAIFCPLFQFGRQRQTFLGLFKKLATLIKIYATRAVTE
jgi:hypothetical protein